MGSFFGFFHCLFPAAFFRLEYVMHFLDEMFHDHLERCLERGEQRHRALMQELEALSQEEERKRFEREVEKIVSVDLGEMLKPE